MATVTCREDGDDGCVDRSDADSVAAARGGGRKQRHEPEANGRHAAGSWHVGRRKLCEHMFVPEIRFTITEHDPQRPWIVIETTRGTIELSEGEDFARWAAQRWPQDRFTVQPDPILKPWLTASTDG